MALALFDAQRRRLLHTLVSFGAIQGAQILLPLLALPWLARVLGPDAFGLLMYMMIISVITAQIMDWGFVLGAVRDVARCREDASALAQVLGQVLSAKTVLAALCCMGAALALPVLPHAASWPGAYAFAVAAGVARGCNPTWYFQGFGQGMRRMACWDVASSALLLLLTVLLVRTAADWPLYLALLTLCKATTYAWLSVGLVRSHGAVPFSLRGGWHALKRTRTLFGSVLAALTYNNGAQMLVSAFLSPRDMGMFLAADKIVRAAVSLVGPVTQTLFPEVCASKKDASRLLRFSLLWTVILMLGLAGAVAALAPQIAAIALGNAYAEAVPVLRLMCLFMPALACNVVLGAQTLVPFGQERFLTGVQTLLAGVSLPLAAALAHWGGLPGAACLPVCVEYSILALLSWGVVRLCPEALACRPR